MKPIAGTYPTYFETYLKQANYPDALTALRETEKVLTNALIAIPQEKGQHRYSSEKWSINELIVHLTDTERIFSYRALRFARNDSQQVLSFDENDYAAQSFADNRTLKSCVDEFLTIRKSTIQLFESFNTEVLLRKGNTAAGSVDVNTLGFIMAGHPMHHLNVLNERYLI
jgi:hypothetical protein